MTFGSKIQKWRTSKTATTEASLHKAIEWLDSIKCHGAGNLGAALQEVVSMETDQVLAVVRSCNLEVGWFDQMMKYDN